jgi:hypothetical protein
MSSVGAARVDFGGFWKSRQNCVLAYCELKKVLAQSTALAILNPKHYLNQNGRYIQCR